MRNISIVCLIGLLVLVPARWALADVAADLRQAEGQYKAGQYTQAEQSYLKVVNEADPNKPAEADAAFTARKKLPLVYIATDRLPQAKDAVQQLLSRYAQYEFLPHAIREIVEGAKPLYKLQVRQLYQDMVAAKPGDSQAIWLKMGVAVASVHLTDDPGTDAVLQDITARHGSDGRAAEALNQIAWACRNLKQYNKALTIYQYAVDNWPQKDRVAFAQHGIVMCQLGLGNPQEADAALDVLIQKFGKDKNASKIILRAGLGYSSAGEVARARKVFELLVQNYPDTQEAVKAQAALAITSVQAEDRNRIEPAVQTLLTKFPPSETKALGLHNVADTLVRKYPAYGERRPTELDIVALLDKCLLVIANYTQATWPGSNWAMWAERDLATVAIQRGDDPNAEAAIGRLTGDYATRKDTPAALYFLGNYCLKANRDDKAEAIYKYLVEKFRSYDLAPLVKTSLGQMRLRQADDQGAEAIFQEVLTDYANHPRLADAVNVMAQEYYDYALRLGSGQPGARHGWSDSTTTYILKAVEQWRIITDQLPEDPSITPTAYYWLAEVYYRLSDYSAALESCTQLITRWPSHDKAWVVHVLAFKTYWQQMEEGSLTEGQADVEMERVRSALLEKYPTSPAASAIRQSMQEKQPPAPPRYRQDRR